MARGWESKSVGDQMAEAADRREKKAGLGDDRAAPTSSKKAVLQLARARTLQDLQQACDRRHRAMLERALEDLDAELARHGE